MSPDPLARLATLEGVGSAMAATRDGIDALLRDRGLRRTAPELTTRSLLVGAHASAALDGSDRSLEQLQAGDLDDVAAGAVRVSTELLGLGPTFASTPLRALARLHVLAGRRITAEDDLGRPKGPEAAQRLGALADLLTTRTEAPALVVAAVVHAELATVAPFSCCNGVVARAAERLVIVGRGVDPTSLLVPEAAHHRLRSAYESNLRAYSEGGTDGVAAWLRYCAEAYAAAAELSPLNG